MYDKKSSKFLSFHYEQCKSLENRFFVHMVSLCSMSEAVSNIAK